MDSRGKNTAQYELQDGAKIAVLGGGPTGSFFSIFALKMAKMMGKEINVTIFEPKDFTKDGPGGCNRCGGIISELLLQTIAVEGINLPDRVVRKGINSYRLHTNHGSVFISTPALEKTIATVYRGGGPKGMAGGEKDSFDNFLLSQAVKEGATHMPLRIDRLEYKSKPVIFSQKNEIMEADLVAGCFGVNSTTGKLFEEMGIGYRKPPTITAAIAELRMTEETIAERFGNSIHLFLIPDKGIKFAAMIPKGQFVTLCILGEEMSTSVVKDFLERPLVKAVLPASYSMECSCLPKMNIGAPRKPFADRVVVCGDAGSTRLFKDGLGAAYLMGKAAAKAAVFQGVGEADFRQEYYPVYKSIIHDNLYGSILYGVIGQYRRWKYLTKAMIEVVRKEQGDPNNTEKILSSILWDMFTGNERYKNVFLKSFKVKMHIDMWEGLFKGLLGRDNGER
jgi:flavin-dependent dehydrogenase